ncbi:MAG TPA: tRNA wybutosine-synthesizing 3 family protein [Candidatus Woesearchaeota archaeon]|jgi:tRNA wybutosine-synthesizing protein 3|nr:tRNA wybutosine-synthesizing 3 family protein [Candidatus Woesearchaeota archaeon]HJN56947.1 tRNA wybutosine-synthesizing 3 family protein [Candidatus Woesearchaeota archaeon]|tara:strand:- start:3422 stop:3997 length:576 start_codon:yes stop_codon:yes gene_type:complete
MDFNKEKIEFLGKKDKSRKKGIDSKIKKLVDRINSFDDFFTTSSCSGRILLLAHHKSGRKDKIKWLFSSHEKVNLKKIKFDELLKEIPREDVWFRVEPVILHITCGNLERAKKLLNTARDIGFRRSGIISVGKNRIVIELISTERIETIISKKGKLLVDEGYFKALIEEGNKKLERTWGKVGKLCEKINIE